MSINHPKNKEFKEIYNDIMDDNGMNERVYGKFKPSAYKCNWNGCNVAVRDEKDYLKHLKYYHGIT